MPNISLYLHSNTPKNEVTVYTMPTCNAPTYIHHHPTISSLQYAQLSDECNDHRSNSRHNLHSKA